MSETSPGANGASVSPPAAQLTEILIDDATWGAAKPERRREWRVVLDDLLAEHSFDVGVRSGLRALVTLLPGRVLVEARAPGATDDAAIREEITVADLEKPLREYLKICADLIELDEGSGSPRLEALDMAKRLVHDDGGRAVQRLFRSLRPDHATSRQLFTLILTLHVDTTRLVRPHHLDATLKARSHAPRRE